MRKMMANPEEEEEGATFQYPSRRRPVFRASLSLLVILLLLSGHATIGDYRYNLSPWLAGLHFLISIPIFKDLISRWNCTLVIGPKSISWSFPKIGSYPRTEKSRDREKIVRIIISEEKSRKAEIILLDDKQDLFWIPIENPAEAHKIAIALRKFDYPLHQNL